MYFMQIIPYISEEQLQQPIQIDYSLGKDVHYKRRIKLSKLVSDRDKKTDIQVENKYNIVNVKSSIDLREIRKHVREPQERLKEC